MRASCRFKTAHLFSPFSYFFCWATLPYEYYAPALATRKEKEWEREKPISALSSQWRIAREEILLRPYVVLDLRQKEIADMFFGSKLY